MTKHHAAIHYRAIRPEFLTPECQLDLLRKLSEWTKPAERVGYTEIHTVLTYKELYIQPYRTAIQREPDENIRTPPQHANIGKYEFAHTQAEAAQGST